MPDHPDRPALLARLASLAATYGYPETAAARLLAAAEAVLAENERVNLTGARDLAAAVDVLVVDSLPVGAAWPVASRPPRVAIDLGTGNGFPGLAVAMRWPDAEVVLVERREKKARAVERVCAAVGAARATVVACDGRELLARRPALRGGADLVVVRAVGPLAPTTKEAAPWLARGGRLVHWKSADVSDDERREGLAAATAAGLVARPDVAFTVSPAHPPRLLVVYERPA